MNKKLRKLQGVSMNISQEDPERVARGGFSPFDENSEKEFFCEQQNKLQDVGSSRTPLS